MLPPQKQQSHVPRYFFDVKDGKDFIDTEDSELASVREVRKQAIVAGGEMIKSAGLTFWDGTEWRMNVTDEAGASIFTLRFSADDHGSGAQVHPLPPSLSC